LRFPDRRAANQAKTPVAVRRHATAATWRSAGRVSRLWPAQDYRRDATAFRADICPAALPPYPLRDLGQWLCVPIFRIGLPFSGFDTSVVIAADVAAKRYEMRHVYFSNPCASDFSESETDG